MSETYAREKFARERAARQALYESLLRKGRLRSSFRFLLTSASPSIQLLFTAPTPLHRGASNRHTEHGSLDLGRYHPRQGQTGNFVPASAPVTPHAGRKIPETAPPAGQNIAPQLTMSALDINIGHDITDMGTPLQHNNNGSERIRNDVEGVEMLQTPSPSRSSSEYTDSYANPDDPIAYGPTISRPRTGVHLPRSSIRTRADGWRGR